MRGWKDGRGRHGEVMMRWVNSKKGEKERKGNEKKDEKEIDEDKKNQEYEK